MLNPKDKILVFEGPDGSGKSTLSSAVCDYFRRNFLPCDLISLPGKENGSLGKIVYEIHHQQSSHLEYPITETTKQLLHLAAHAEVVHSKLTPALERGKIVILDRFWWSLAVYGRLNGVDERVISHVISLEKYLWRDIHPTVILLTHCIENKTIHFNSILNLYKELIELESFKFPIHLLEASESIDRDVNKIANLLNSWDLNENNRTT